MSGLAPATRTTACGSQRPKRLPATVGSPASATSGWILPAPPASSAKEPTVRATAITGAPLAARAVVTPRPRPRDAPTTIVVLSDGWLEVIALSPFARTGFSYGSTRRSQGATPGAPGRC